jgi:hypothetical protein
MQAEGSLTTYRIDVRGDEVIVLEGQPDGRGWCLVAARADGCARSTIPAPNGTVVLAAAIALAEAVREANLARQRPEAAGTSSEPM